MMTIKEYAQNQGVTYEAIRKQLKRYASELDGHIHQIGRRQFLDDFAMDFLADKRNDSPIIQRQQDKDEQIASLKLQVEQMLVKNAELNEKVAKMAEKAAKTEMLEQSVRSKDEQIASQTAEIADFKALVAVKDKSLEDGKKQLQEEQQAHYNTASELANTQKQLTDAEQELERLKNRNLWQRIFNK